MKETKIEWTDHTFNPWEGCTNVSPGCDNCYAEARANRFHTVQWGNAPRRRTSKATWRGPIKWQKNAPDFRKKHDRRQRVFCASLADVFDNQVDPAWRADSFDLIRITPDLDWLLLTKRPQNISKMLPVDWDDIWERVWLGCTTEAQKYFDQRIEHLTANPAAVHFVSYELAIGPLRLPENEPRPDWVICGGESGPGARPMTPQWARDIRDDCQRYGIAFFMKQWGSLRSNPLIAEQGLSLSEAKKQVDPYGKGGALLDGKLWREFPSSIRRIAERDDKEVMEFWLAPDHERLDIPEYADAVTIQAGYARQASKMSSKPIIDREKFNQLAVSRDRMLRTMKWLPEWQSN